MHREDMKAEFRKRDLSVKAVAKLIGFSRQAVSDNVNGRKQSPQIQTAIAQLLDMPVEKVFPNYKGPPSGASPGVQLCGRGPSGWEGRL
jgi:lambda repressor-like predicted transcriptional regulator